MQYKYEVIITEATGCDDGPTASGSTTHGATNLSDLTYLPSPEDEKVHSPYITSSHYSKMVI